ncbi:serine/threonine-protein phosphatase CPPED1 isoform X3 [Opisthocomus hoazin]
MKAWAVGDTNNGDDEWGEEIKLAEQAVQAVNKLNPKPKFFVLCGDLIHGMPGTPWRKDQEQDLKNVLKNTDQDIPLVFVSGNHDIGNTPTRETIDNYCKNWGDDYFSFWVGGVFFIVLNSQLYFDSSKCPELKQAQDVWLNEQLAVAEKHKCKHMIVFQHIPLFLRKPDEDHNYFNLEKSVRQEIMEKFHKAGPSSPESLLAEGRCHTGVSQGTFHTLGESVYPEAEPEVGLASNDGRKEERMGSQQSKRALRKKFPDSVLCQPACCTFPPSFPIVSLVPIPTNPPKMMCCLVPS